MRAPDEGGDQRHSAAPRGNESTLSGNRYPSRGNQRSSGPITPGNQRSSGPITPGSESFVGKSLSVSVIEWMQYVGASGCRYSRMKRQKSYLWGSGGAVVSVCMHLKTISSASGIPLSKREAIVVRDAVVLLHGHPPATTALELTAQMVRVVASAEERLIRPVG